MKTTLESPLISTTLLKFNLYQVQLAGQYSTYCMQRKLLYIDQKVIKEILKNYIW